MVFSIPLTLSINNNNATSMGQAIQNNVLSPSIQNTILNLILPANSNYNCGDPDDMFNGLGNWCDSDDGDNCGNCNNGNGYNNNNSYNDNSIAKGLPGFSSTSPFIRNFYRNISNGGRSTAWWENRNGYGNNNNNTNNNSYSRSSRGRRFASKIKKLLSALLLLGLLKGNNNVF